MKLAKIVGSYRIYELEERECKQHYREYPTFACWFGSHHEDIGNMSLTENEASTLEEMVDWCNDN